MPDRAVRPVSALAIARLVGRSIALVIALGGLVAVRAQTVHGQVLEQGTERPVAGATVSAMVSDTQVVATATTDASGICRLALPRGGTFTLGVRYIGYVAGVSRSFDLVAGDEYEPTLYMSTAAIAQPLAPDTIRVRTPARGGFADGFEERRARGFGEFVTRDQTARRGNTTPIALLHGIAGVSIARDRLGEEFVISSRGYLG